jgi:hypothetical protein
MNLAVATTKKPQESSNAFSLSPVESQRLLEAFEQRGADPLELKASRYADIILNSSIPVGRIKQALWSSNAPYFVVNNLRLDALGANWEIGETPIASRVLLAMLGALGLSAFGYRQEKKGQILHDMFPIPGAERTFSNAGRVPFELHTENPYLPRAARPGVLVLMALNNSSRTATQLATADDIVEGLSVEGRRALMQSTFSFRQSDSFELNGYAVHATKTPILKIVDGHNELRWGITTASSEREGQEAISEFRAVSQKKAFDVVLEPGQLLIFNNKRCVHGRGAVEGLRWIKRVYGTDVMDCVGDDGLIDVWATLSDKKLDHSF